MSFTRFPLSRILLPSVACELPLHYLDYCPYTHFKLGYIRLPDGIPSPVPPEHRQDIVVAHFFVSSLSGFSFNETDEYVMLMFNEVEVLNQMLIKAVEFDIVQNEVPGNFCKNSRILIYFADTQTGTEFRECFMNDLAHAFSCARLHRDVQVSVAEEHMVKPNTSSPCLEDGSKCVEVSEPQAPEKDFGSRSQVDICGSEQESELASSSVVINDNCQNAQKVRATDSEVPSSPEKEALASTSSTVKDRSVRNSRVILMEPGLYIPPALFDYLKGDVLSPLAKIQTLGSRNLLASVRTYLFRRGENGGLSQMDIARELSNHGYWREVAQLWENYSEGKTLNYDFAFKRLISFLEWTVQNLDFVTDYGKLSAEGLMLCRNTRWHETEVVRKKFDKQMRHYFIDEEDLLAVRSWCGILREKTVFDAAMARASCLTALDLGTMVTESKHTVSKRRAKGRKGSFTTWDLRQLFKQLDNITDLTWLNCTMDGDECALLDLKTVEKLKRLVLHITKCNTAKFEKFFARFGWENHQDSHEIVEADAPYEENIDEYDASGYDTESSFIDDRDEEELLNDRYEASAGSSSVEVTRSKSREASSDSSAKNSVDVQLDYAALSFAFSLYRTRQITKKRMDNLEVFARMFTVPKAVLMAKSMALNVPKNCLRYALDFVGNNELEMFSVGLPYEYCTKIHPNRTPYRDLLDILDNMQHFVNRRWMHRDIRFHVMVDFYVPDRVCHLLNLVVQDFPAAETITLRFETARRRDKDFYKTRRQMSEPIIPRNVCVFNLAIDALTYRIPLDLSVFECYTLEEFHLSLSGVSSKSSNLKLKEDLAAVIRKLMNASLLPNLHTMVFRINAPLLMELCDSFVNTLHISKRNNRLRTIGFVCTASQRRCPTIRKRIQDVHFVAGNQLERFILDVRVLGGFSKEEMLRLHEVMPNCVFEAQLAPDDCKYIDSDDNLSDSDCYRSPSNSPRLDEGIDRHLCSDYSDEGILPHDSCQASTIADESNQTIADELESLLDEDSQPSSSQEIVLSKTKEGISAGPSGVRVLRSGRTIATTDANPSPSSSDFSGTKSRQPRNTRKTNLESEDDSDEETERSRKKKRQKMISSSSDEHDSTKLAEKIVEQGTSSRRKESVRKRRSTELRRTKTSSGPSEEGLSSDSDEWSPGKPRKTKRSRRRNT